MTAPRVPITREEYEELLAMGVSREEINAKAVIAPTGGGKQPAPKVPLDPVGVAMQGVPLVGPWTDEAIGGASGATQYLLDKVRGKPTTLKGSVQQGMRDADARVRATREAMSRVVPGSDMTLEAVAGLATGGAAAKAAPKAVQALLGNVRSAGRSNKVVDFLEKAAKRVGAGAGAGYVMGAGAAREGERNETGMMTALVGGGIGGLSSLAEGGAIAKDRIGSWWRNRAPGAIFSKDPRTMAAEALEKTVRVDQLDDVLAGRTPTRAETVADVAATSPSNYTDALGREAISRPTEAGGAIKRQMAERAAGRGQRVEQALTRGTGLIPEQPEVTKRMVTEVTRPNVTSAYQAALDPDLAIDSPVLRDVLEYGRNPAELQDSGVQRALAFARNKMGESRTAMASEGFSAPFLDYTKRGLDAQITSAIKKGDISTARNLMITRERLIREIDPRIPGYAEARAVDEGRRALINAMELGRKLGRGTVDVRDAEDMLRRLTPDSDDYADPESIRNMFRRGIADGIRRRMGRKATGEGAIGAVIGNRNAEEVTRLAFPDDASFQAFEQQLMDEMRQLPGEAMTRGARVDASIFANNPIGPATPWGLGQAFQGNPALFAAQVAGDITRQSGHQMNEKAAGVIADVMRSRPGAPNVQDILRRIAQQRAEPARRAGVAAAAGQKATTTNIALQRLLQAYLGRGSE